MSTHQSSEEQSGSPNEVRAATVGLDEQSNLPSPPHGELLPCPFCGGDDLTVNANSVECAVCGGSATLDWTTGMDGDEAIIAWNRRASDQHLAELTKERDEAVKVLEPFAAYIAGAGSWLPDSAILTQGSALARLQVTAGQFRAAAALLSSISGGEGKGFGQTPEQPQCADPQAVQPMGSVSGAEGYRGWWIEYDPPPIPVRSCDWSYWHDNFDGAPHAGDNRCGHAPSLGAAKAAIDDWEAEHGAA